LSKEVWEQGGIGREKEEEFACKVAKGSVRINSEGEKEDFGGVEEIIYITVVHGTIGKYRFFPSVVVFPGSQYIYLVG
jgi:hypothetical protein